ncbi:parallel beta-helix domain-containing protein [Pseudoxanthomonas sp. PXM04]|jgi:parallel beta-helix repeat protein|uniref:parallel beta-helix domain-containing protein n=2 Tax=unclassified Pseudoxanthomonas TaxID=2645906 RepID=UPI0017831D50|nr:parallel beta-helix domain-containing protein [Pseudoxanthomonas sp. PXM04]MBD9375833.1 right-handed parallel beta-helix repeat-containing protein [Pseudoxanthomonas sp. PXM04]UBB25843.1 right-handed parallel beta-helix repeat-containing protein [Pseudoxanthomonas japonensis]
MQRTMLMAGLALALAACQPKGDEQAPKADAASTDFARKLHERLLDAKPGEVIEIPAGTYHFDRSLTLRADGVTIRGAGMDKTVLSFKGQKAGAEGLLVNGDDFAIENLTIQDSKGDGLKISESENITIRGVKVEWTGGPSTKNGAYGLYPVLTKNVLIEDSVSIGASDAGIYVGQSDGVIVRRSRAEKNVAGIEIENTINADVHDNVATGNTGGILVFNMPGLKQQGGNIRVFNNKVIANNHENFGAKGTPVASVPAGSGIVVNSNDDIEIFGNEIRDNATTNIIISSVYSTGYKDSSKSETFDPYPERIYVHGNTLSGGGDSPDGFDLKALKVAMYGLRGNFPDVLWDGYFNKDRKVDGQARGPEICLRDVSGVINADGPGGYKSPSKDTRSHQCELPRLPAVDLKRG